MKVVSLLTAFFIHYNKENIHETRFKQFTACTIYT
jgi:hypothetical protein